MKIDVGAGVIGQGGTHWGTDPEGNVIYLVKTARFTVLITFSLEEAKTEACSAIYVATKRELEIAATMPAPPGMNGGAANGRAPSSLLIGLDGAPLAVPR